MKVTASILAPLFLLLLSGGGADAKKASALTRRKATRHINPSSPHILSPSRRISRGGGLGGFWTAYNNMLDEKPIQAKALTSMTGFLLGDLLAQLAVEKGEFDLKRILRMGSFGLLLHGTTGHYFYNWLDEKIPGAGPLQVAAKVAIDQTCWAPIFMVMFFSYMKSFDGNFDAIVPAIQNELVKSVMASWKTWIPGHTINFAFVPTKYRLFYINAIQIGFNCYLSILGSK